MGLRSPQGDDGCQTSEGCKLWLAHKKSTPGEFDQE